MVITVVGSGYVGLVTGVCLAELGHEVSCVDTNHQKISKIKEGVLPIYEPELDNMFNRNIEKGLFNTSIELTNCISESDVIIIAVGTPIKDGDIDLSYIQKVSEDIGLAIRETKKYHVICVKSTVVPGTTENIVKPIIEKFSGKNIGDGFGLAMNPEFLAEGSAVKDFMNPDRIVIGSLNQKSIDILIEMYSAF